MPSILNQTTPLILSIIKGHPIGHDNVSMSNYEITHLLLRQGARADIPDENGFTPLHYAFLRRDRETIELLLAFGAKLDIKNNEGKTPQDMLDMSYSACKDKITEVITAITFPSMQIFQKNTENIKQNLPKEKASHLDEASENKIENGYQVYSLLNTISENERLSYLDSHKIHSIIKDAYQLSLVLSQLPETERLVYLTSTNLPLASMIKNGYELSLLLNKLTEKDRSSFFNHLITNNTCNWTEVIKYEAQLCYVLNKLPEEEWTRFFQKLGEEHLQTIINTQYQTPEFIIFEELDDTKQLNLLIKISDYSKAFDAVKNRLLAREDKSHYAKYLFDEIILHISTYTTNITFIQSMQNDKEENRQKLIMTSKQGDTSISNEPLKKVINLLAELYPFQYIKSDPDLNMKNRLIR